MKKILVIVLMFVTTVLPAQDKMDRLMGSNDLMLALIGFIVVLVGAIFWNRRRTLKSFEIRITALEKEVKELKEKDLKHEEKEKKAEIFFKRLIEKYPDLANS